MTDRYVILTGGKNNAGDFLIAHRSKKLFQNLRPDREILEYKAWEPLGKTELEAINESNALILVGGPAIQPTMYPGIYPLCSNLDAIKVPIIMMGLGQKLKRGTWESTHDYILTPDTKKLLSRVSSSGYISSVRDYHTFNILTLNSCKNVIVTGCPALYDDRFINKSPAYPNKVNKVAFSLGVSFVIDRAKEAILKKLIIALRQRFKQSTFEVVFHHSLDKDIFYKAYGKNEIHHSRHLEFSKWLDTQSISYVDVSGNAKNLMTYYENVDLHVGYRVHAHIYMNSISKPSILIAEDGRGAALRRVIGDVILNQPNQPGFVDRLLQVAYRKRRSPYSADRLILDVQNQLDYEIDNGYPRSMMSRSLIDAHYTKMKNFLAQLP
jgi:hypothetical protein